MRIVSVTSIAWYEEDKRFAVGFSDGVISLCSRQDFEQPININAHKKSIFALSWDPTGCLLASQAVGDEELHVWMISNDEGFTSWSHFQHSAAVTDMRWCSLLGTGPDKRLMLASGCEDGLIYIWTVPQPSSSSTLRTSWCNTESTLHGEDDPQSSHMKPKASRLRKKAEVTLCGHIAPISALAFSPDGLMLASGCTKGWLNIWSIQDKCLLQTYTGTGTVKSLEWFVDRSIAACFSRCKDVVILNYTSELFHSNRVTALARKSLKQQAIMGLSQAKCFFSLLQKLPSMLQEQYQYEKSISAVYDIYGCELTAGHSSLFLSCTTSSQNSRISKREWCGLLGMKYRNGLGLLGITRGLLWTVMDQLGVWIVGDLEHLVKEWQWLLTYSCAIKSADALLHRQSFPPTFKLLNKERIKTDGDALAYDNKQWDLTSDSQVMSWATQQPEDWQTGGRPLKQLEAIFLMVYKIRSVLVSFRCRNPEEDSDKTLIGQRCTEAKLDVPHNDTREEELISETPEHSRVENLEENIDADSDHEHHETDVDEEQQLASRVTPQEKKNEFSYEEMCYKYLEKCIFLLLCVRPPLSGDSSEFLQNTVKKAQQNEGSSEISDLSEMSPRRTITRQGSLPDIFSDMQDDQVAGFRDGMGTPTLNSLNPRHQLASNLNSLQKVKEMLRRLRWRQERINAIGSGQGWNKKEPCNFPENCIVTDMMQFVCGEQKNGYIDNLDVEQLVKAMELQQERAESRLYALNQIIELLTTGKEKDDEPKNNSSPNTTLLNSVHLQLLAGCFGLLVLRSEYTSVSNQLYHYQDGIRAASAQTQQEIQLVVHQIYEVLVMSLIDLIKMDNIGQF
ncbi:putative E3 ubiquitin-protein ligase herc1 [Bulinus truncatus]|nr:putative E3 ubiquitin-protein ligase herc1 [Bulinus truncatus]